MQSVVNATKSSWNEFEFPKFQSEIGEIAVKIASDQEQGQLSRKKLVEVFLQFRNSVSEDVKKAVAPVLRSFQTEVDNLTARSQTVEDAFIQVYQRLAEMPDPSLALAEAETVIKQAERVSDLRMENTKLRENVEELKTELLTKKANESLLRKANERMAELEAAGNRLEEDYQKRLQDQLEEKEREMGALVTEANTRTSEAEMKINSLSEALKTVQSQVFSLQTHLEEVKSAKTRESEILLNDLEKANERIVVLQQQCQSTEHRNLNETEPAPNSNTTETVQLLTRIEELESELEAKKEEATNLMSHLNLVECEHKQEVASLHSRLESTNSTLVATTESLSSLQLELQAKSDYDAIKKELEVLRSIEFQQEAGDSPVTMDDPLEFRLRRKNEQLQNRIASISAEKDKFESELMLLREKSADLTEREARQRALISRLEADLNRLSSWRQQQQQQHLLQEISDVDGRGEGVETATPLIDLLSSAEEDKETVADSSILTIVQSQRDRLRQQNRELEENLLALRQQMVTAQTELESLRQDNIKLYEKIRFVQTYSAATSPGRGGGDDDAVLARYSNAYEAGLNPFKHFGQQERHRRYQALQPHEKIMHTLGRMIVNNRGARLATFAYALVMHLLIFLVLYKMVTATEPICPSVVGPNVDPPLP